MLIVLQYLLGGSIVYSALRRHRVLGHGDLGERFSELHREVIMAVILLLLIVGRRKEL